MTEDEYDLALLRIEALIEKETLTDEEEHELVELAIRVQAYEKEHFLDS